MRLMRFMRMMRTVCEEVSPALVSFAVGSLMLEVGFYDCQLSQCCKGFMMVAIDASSETSRTGSPYAAVCVAEFYGSTCHPCQRVAEDGTEEHVSIPSTDGP